MHSKRTACRPKTPVGVQVCMNQSEIMPVNMACNIPKVYASKQASALAKALKVQVKVWNIVI